ncbi:MAG: D-alanine--D-alanine ligase [Deltaproteobacteria bacterium]|nr:D-alanine--D-alanine ligase [Deltaproteobacteria bacterium]
MARQDLRVALVFGGRSAEHEVSRRSARSIFEAMIRGNYEILPVLITQEGSWYLRPALPESFSADDLDEADRALMSPDPQHGGILNIDAEGRLVRIQVDVVFPVLHGTYGEDGTLQGLFELADVPYVGCGVLASSVGMDKVLMKIVFRDAGLELTPYFWFLRSQWRSDRSPILERMKAAKFPLFVKPANLGSSVGITRVDRPAGFEAAVELAMRFDRKVIVEEGVNGQELEVSVLGNDDPVASVPGEIVSHSQFYDYEEKYLRDTAELIIPAQLPEHIVKGAKDVAVRAFKAVDGSGLARVDMFLTADERLVINEINTLPGFTSISMYPKLWEATGMSYEKLIERLIELALERHQDKQQTLTCRKLP